MTGAIAALLVAATGLQACDTPVYQYAMHNWQPDRYEVRYFHRAGERPAADSAANERLRRASVAEGGSANVAFHAVEVGPDGTVAEEHAGAWLGHRAADLPLHVVTSPTRGELYSGRLDVQMAGQLVESPKRRELAQELSSGRAGVLVVLVDRAAGDGERALEVAREAVAEEADGERPLGLVSVDRGDPAERWLVRQLLSIEEDLPELRASMVFGAFGRGHVLPPFVGAGVTVQGMRDLVRFIHGPCACEVKASNPGIGLLVSWNWTERLPQWATGAAVQPSFVLLNFGGDPGEGAGDEAERADPDRPASQASSPPAPPGPDAPGDRPETDSSEALPASRVAPDPELSGAPSPPAQVRLARPSATIDAPTPEGAASAPTAADGGGSHQRAGAAAPTAPRADPPAAGAPPAADEPEQDPAEQASGRSPTLVRRVPELPASDPVAARATQTPVEESSLGGDLALRLGLILLAVAAVALGVGQLVLRRGDE